MEILGRYRLESEIGRGAYGIVYRAIDVELSRIVALKVLRQDRATPAAQDRFFREARIVAGLSHPGIVRVFEAGQENGRAFFAMELLEGETLAARLERGPLSELEAVSIGEALARALDFAHRRGIVHRDIKPANVVLAERGPVLTDFGLAFTLPQERLTETGELLGTPAYMAPEILIGLRADARSDLYSLGALLYETVVGHPPFEAQNFLELSHQVLHESPTPPPVLSHAILRCLHKDPDRRFESAGQLAEALARPRQGRRHQRIAAGIAAAIALSTLLPLATCGSRASESRVAPLAFITSTPSGARVLLEDSAEGRVLGETPLSTPLPPGRHRLRFSKAGYLDRRREITESPLHVRLFTPGEIPRGMAFVTDTLLADRLPVTCRDYEGFLRLSFRPAPFRWRRLRGDAPVTGISYEDACAYAQWREKRLPTLEEWRLVQGTSNLREWTNGSIVAGSDAITKVSPDIRSPLIGFRCVKEIQE